MHKIFTFYHLRSLNQNTCCVLTVLYHRYSAPRSVFAKSIAILSEKFQIFPSPLEIHCCIAIGYTGVKCRLHHIYTDICCASWVFYSALYGKLNF